jgi:hypothetical protein
LNISGFTPSVNGLKLQKIILEGSYGNYKKTEQNAHGGNVSDDADIRIDCCRMLKRAAYPPCVGSNCY